MTGVDRIRLRTSTKTSRHSRESGTLGFLKRTPEQPNGDSRFRGNDPVENITMQLPRPKSSTIIYK